MLTEAERSVLTTIRWNGTIERFMLTRDEQAAARALVKRDILSKGHTENGRLVNYSRAITVVALDALLEQGA